MTARHTVFWTVAAAVIVCVVMAGYTSVNRKSNDSVSGYCAMLPDAIGLYSGNPVTQMGFEVGSIHRIEPGDNGVRVEFSVASDRPVPASVKAVTRSKSVLADNSLELVGNYRSGATLGPGDCIPLERSFTRKTISEITGSVADLVEEIAPNGDTKNLEAALSGAAGAVDGVGGDLAKLMRTASGAVSDPESEVSDLRSIIVNMAPLTGDTLAKWKDVASIMTKLPHSADVAAEPVWRPAAQHMMGGLTPIFQALTDVQKRYGEKYIWPTVDDFVGPIHIAATRVPEIQRALKGLPGIASDVAMVARNSRGHALRITAPQIRVSEGAEFAAVCKKMNEHRTGSCTRSESNTRGLRADLSDLLTAWMAR